jgi:hypothetical protein
LIAVEHNVFLGLQTQSESEMIRIRSQNVIRGTYLGGPVLHKKNGCIRRLVCSRKALGLTAHHFCVGKLVALDVRKGCMSHEELLGAPRRREFGPVLFGPGGADLAPKESELKSESISGL